MTDHGALAFPTGGKLFCFGFGYSAHALAHHLVGADLQIAGTRTRPETAAGSSIKIAAFDGTAMRPDVTHLLAGTTHVLLSIPPDADGDPALRCHGADLAALPALRWIGYLSTIGVYGDTGGTWIDETAPMQPGSGRGQRRVLAETQWRAFGRRHGKHVEIFRLPGIYGPGRSTFDALRAGTARRLIKPGQVFNRAHVADIAGAVARAMHAASSGTSPPFDTYNLVDDEPAPPQDVVTFAAQLLSVAPPPETAFDPALLSPMARSFYNETKRVSNARLKTALGYTFAHPTYRDGLSAILAGERAFN